MAGRESITIAVDAMGGYHAPAEIVAAVAEASLRREAGAAVNFLLVGDEIAMTEALFELDHNSERIHLYHAPTVIGMGERARSAVEARPDASVVQACSLVRQGEADALISAGHPGAAVLSASRQFGLVPGARHAALASVYPTPRLRGEAADPFSLILDVGASLRATPDELLSFGLMGSAYARIVSRNERPRVALLSTSRESTMGTPEVVEAHELLSRHKGINFYGNIEGHEIPRGLADVVVCEGFVGDVVIKMLEGVSEAAFDLARSAYHEKMAWRMGLSLLSGGLQKLKQLTDFEAYGGAPLLGLDKVVILCHPRSGRRAVGNALRLAIKNVRAELPEAIAASLSGEPRARRG
ncbi:phosphate acyltransferase PlsX [Lujinxingia litoralis]|uniref:phosphate acyltransferase PlsX n=1 Tax=Lujinxingia litoralis TaxID=2211119 RepID=UPI0024BFCBCF|nr:phosphate acyltransferase PlsX [Lujinxingia litoralis]